MSNEVQDRATPVDAMASALDVSSTLELARIRRHAWQWLAVAVVACLPMMVIGVRFLSAQLAMHTIDARIVSRDTGGVVDPVVVTWDHGTHRSVVHVEDSMEWCGPGPDEPGCTHPVFIVDPFDRGHASIDGELDLSPLASLYFFAMLFLGVFVALMVVIGQGKVLHDVKRRRRLLAQTVWRPAWLRVHGSRRRGALRGATCSVAFENDDDVWRPMNVRGRQNQLQPLLDEERIEIAACGNEGQAVVRSVGGTMLFDAELHAFGSEPLARTLQGAGVALDIGATAAANAVRVLVGSAGDYDIVDPYGDAVGEVTGKFRGWPSTSTFEVLDRDGAPVMTVTRRGTRWRAAAADGAEIASASRATNGKSFTFAARPEQAAAARAIAGSRRRVEADSSTPGKKARRYTTPWTLQADTRQPLARVTMSNSARVLELLVDADDALRSTVFAQCMIVAIGAVIPSNGGGGA